MATKKDLVEAYSFSRRRLVTAFVSGAPGGREVEPTRPGRTIVGGLALAVLLAAGAAIAGVFAPRTPDDWTQHGLIVSKDTGQAYVILPGADGEMPETPDDVVLRPVINITSAALILGPDVEPMLISQDTIDDQRVAEDVGILGAPVVPTASLLIDSGWTACTGNRAGIQVRVAETPDVTAAPAAGTTVQSGGDYYAVVDTDSGTYLYSVREQKGPGGDQTDNLLAQLELPPKENAVEVPRDWINLFPVGSPLDLSSFRLDHFGDPPEEPLTGDAEDAVVGDLLETADGEYLLVTYDGPVELPDFAAGVYRNLVLPDGDAVEPVQVASAPSVDRGSGSFLAGTHWPAELPEQFTTDPCAQLTAVEGEAPVARLVSPGDSSAVGDLGADDKDPLVDTGRGAYVLSGGWSGAATGAAPYVIDNKGRANPLVGPDTATQLGFAGVPVPVVPDTWVELFRCGVSLSEDAAMQPPTEASESACD